MAQLEHLPVSLDTSTHVELKHVRGYLERDLRPERMWTKNTSPGCRHGDRKSTEVSSSSGGVSIDLTNSVDVAVDTLEKFGHRVDHRVRGYQTTAQVKPERPAMEQRWR